MVLDERRKALEEQFFNKENADKIAKLRASKERDAIKERLRTESGMTDESVLDKLVELGINADTVHALSLVPLVMVAWADGSMHDHEREAILHGATGKGIEESSKPYELLVGWLSKRPGSELMDAWESYITALLEHLTAKQQEILAAQVIDRAREVAKVAGGFLGIASISAAEEKVLARVEAAFGR